MPQRYIQIPGPVTIVNQESREPIKSPDGKDATVTFAQLVAKLLNNPQFAESYAAIQSADAITVALDEARDGVMQLAEEDWNRLRDAVQNLRTATEHGPQAGLGWQPWVTRQLLPLLRAIMTAADKAPARAAEPLKAVE